ISDVPFVSAVKSPNGKDTGPVMALPAIQPAPAELSVHPDCTHGLSRPQQPGTPGVVSVFFTHLPAPQTKGNLVCRLFLLKKKKTP
ncbi:hypothetical protein, partial [Neisseria meningitidis]|uniref:hypothetical protein n=1 Tax=Neisseria meningitidis TaxID=487 RepID=UPI0021C0DB9F